MAAILEHKGSVYAAVDIHDWHNTGGNGKASAVWRKASADDKRTASIWVMPHRCMVDCWERGKQVEEGVPFENLNKAKAYAEAFLGGKTAATRTAEDAPPPVAEKPKKRLRLNAVYFITKDWETSNSGKSPRGVGRWGFSVKRDPDLSPGKNEVFWVNGTYQQAKKKAAEHYAEGLGPTDTIHLWVLP